MNNTRFKRPIRGTIGTIFLGVMTLIWTLMYVLWGAGNWVASTQNGPHQPQFAAHEARYEGLIAAGLYEQPLGYISDNTVPHDFGLTAYTIAPQIIVRGADCCTVVILDFADSAHATAYAAEHALMILEDFGDGLMLAEGAQ